MLRQVDSTPTAASENAALEDPGRAEQPESSRRGFFGMLSKAALGVVAGVAHLLSSTEAALAHGYHYACCHLAKSPSGGYCAYNCWRYAGQGYAERGWYCHDAGINWYCFECTGGPTCWYGPFLCSDYFAT